MAISAYGPGKQFQHYLPQLLLDAWCDGNGKLTRYHEPHTSKLVFSRTSKRSTGGETNLYTLMTLGRGPSDESDFDENGNPRFPQTQMIENYFADQIDTSEVKDAIGKLCTNIEINVAEKRSVSRFISSINYRNPPQIMRFYEKHRASIESLIKDIETRIVEFGIDVTDRERMPDFLKLLTDIHTERNIYVELNAHLFDMLKSINNPELISSLCRTSWIVYRKHPDEENLLVSDTPLMFGHSFDVGQDAIDWVLPLSPEHLLFAVEPDLVGDFIAISRDRSYVTQVNTLQIQQAYSNVYSKDEGQFDFVKSIWFSQPTETLGEHPAHQR